MALLIFVGFKLPMPITSGWTAIILPALFDKGSGLLLAAISLQNQETNSDNAIGIQEFKAIHIADIVNAGAN